MKNLVEKYPYCLYWVDCLKMDKRWTNIRFKKLETGYPPFVLYPFLFDVVSLEDFITPEENRMPLFIGSQFGIHPRLENIFTNKEDGEIIIAILNKSLLSGHVAGLKISVYRQGNNSLEKLIFFDNKKIRKKTIKNP